MVLQAEDSQGPEGQHPAVARPGKPTTTTITSSTRRNRPPAVMRMQQRGQGVRESPAQHQNAAYSRVASKGGRHDARDVLLILVDDVGERGQGETPVGDLASQHELYSSAPKRARVILQQFESEVKKRGRRRQDGRALTGPQKWVPARQHLRNQLCRCKQARLTEEVLARGRRLEPVEECGSTY
jgi:hypothetical protein